MKLTRRDFVFSMLAAGASAGTAGIMSGLAPQNAIAAETGAKNLIIFFSRTGNTKAIAARIHQKVGGDLLELKIVKPYSADYDTCIKEAKRDQEQGIRPELKSRIPNMAAYSTVYLGYPNWWGHVPMPIASLLESYDFSGKTIAPFCSHGGGGLGQSLSDIAKFAAGAKVTEGLALRGSGGSSLPDEIDAWLKKIGLGA